MKSFYSRFQNKYFQLFERRSFKNVDPNAILFYDVEVSNKDNLVMADNTRLGAGATIMNPKARFIMKHHSGAALGLLVITGNHPMKIDRFYHTCTREEQEEIDKKYRLDRDVVVEEDVWIGARVTILRGVTVGRGCIIGAGSVIRESTPPYSIVMGNPAKVVGFKFTLKDIIEREIILYNEDERIPIETLEKNYEVYYTQRKEEIKAFKSLY